MSLTSIGVVLGIITSVFEIVNGIVDLIRKMPRKNELSVAADGSFNFSRRLGL